MIFFRKCLTRIKRRNNDFEIFLGGNTNVKNILVFTEYVNATYFISFDIPMRLMHAEGKVNLAVASQNHVELQGAGCWEKWEKKFKPDAIVMTRYGHESGIKILEYFKSRNIPVIYHIDDDLLEVPDSLGDEIKKRQGADGVVGTRRHLLANSHLIYASTPYLASLMQSRFPKQKVFHGIYAPYMGDEIKSRKPALRQNPVIGYMGSKGHQHDLELVVPAIVRLLEEREELTFEIFGTIKMPKELERFGSRVQSHVVQKSYVEFLSTLSDLNWDVGLAPLVVADFNQCKAPTKFIEYTACGIPVVASSINVYSDIIPKNSGVLVEGYWYESLTLLLDDKQKAKSMREEAHQFCSRNFSIKQLQQQLLDVFNKVET